MFKNTLPKLIFVIINRFVWYIVQIVISEKLNNFLKSRLNLKYS